MSTSHVTKGHGKPSGPRALEVPVQSVATPLEGRHEHADSPQEVRLLARISAGDTEAFAEFYDRCADQVLGLQTRILGDRAEAEDALQDAFWHVWSKAGAYNPVLGTPRAWVLTIARSRALDRLRKQRKRMATLELMDGQEHHRTTSGRDQSHQARASSIPLHTLPAEQWQAVRLAYFGGLTREQIARIQSVPVGTVKTRIRGGLTRLREALDAPAGRTPSRTPSRTKGGRP